jgi:hypothetical protein
MACGVLVPTNLVDDRGEIGLELCDVRENRVAVGDQQFTPLIDGRIPVRAQLCERPHAQNRHPGRL